MATETENNGPESKEIKDVKEMKEALKDDAPPDNKQEEKDAAAKKDETAGKKDDDAAAATAAAPAKASTVHHPDYEKDVVYLYQFPRTPLLPSLSPYGLKVETWLRLNGIKYEVSVARAFFPLPLPPSRAPAPRRPSQIGPLRAFLSCVRAMRTCVPIRPSVRLFADLRAREDRFILLSPTASFSLLRRNSARAVEAFSRCNTAREIALLLRRGAMGVALATQNEAGVNKPNWIPVYFSARSIGRR